MLIGKLGTHVPLLKRRTLAACGVLWLLASGAAAQVRTEVRLEKPRYVAGEPVFVIVDVTNIGSWPIAYDGRGKNLDPTVLTLSAENVQPDRSLSDVLRACYVRGGGGELWVDDHPPLLMPGAQRPFRYLLGGYTLVPGRHRVNVSGRVNLEWARADYLAMNAALIGKEIVPAGTPVRASGDPVEGAVEGAYVDRQLDLVVDAGSDEALRAAFAPYLADADGPDELKRMEARRTILTLGPPLLEDSIIRFTREQALRGDGLAGLGAAALGRLATDRSRMALKELVTTRDVSLQFAFVEALSAIAVPDDVPFLANMLSAPDVSVRLKGLASLGLGHVGTDDAIGALSRALPTADPTLSRSIIQGLGISRSRSAVPALIGSVDRFGTGGSDICDALATLTHFRWCDVERDRDRAALRARWERWWAANGTTTRIYGNDACVVEEKLPPLQ